MVTGRRRGIVQSAIEMIDESTQAVCSIAPLANPLSLILESPLGRDKDHFPCHRVLSIQVFALELGHQWKHLRITYQR